MSAPRIALCDGNNGQAGLFRKAIQDAFIEQGVQATVIVTKGLGIRALSSTLEGIDVVFCFPDTWDLACGSYQMDIADAALHAKVGLLIPFEYGNPMGCLEDDPPVILAAHRLRKHLKAIGQAYVSFLTGPAADIVLPGLLRLRLELEGHYQADVTGEGRTPISWITSTDVGRYIAGLIATVPWITYANRVINIQGDPKTIIDLIDMASRLADVTISPTLVDKEAMRKEAGPNPSPKTFITWLMVAWEDGRAHVQGNGDNALVAGFTVQPVRDVLWRNMEEGGLIPAPP